MNDLSFQDMATMRKIIKNMLGQIGSDSPKQMTALQPALSLKKQIRKVFLRVHIIRLEYAKNEWLR